MPRNVTTLNVQHWKIQNTSLKNWNTIGDSTYREKYYYLTDSTREAL
jgi:hypothetical protein